MSALYRLQILSVTMAGSIPALSLSIASNTVGASDTITFAAPLLDGQSNPLSIADPYYLPIVVEPNTDNVEVMWITAYTPGATTATVLRGAEGIQVGGAATAPMHLIGSAFVHAATPQDLLNVPAGIYAWSNFQ